MTEQTVNGQCLFCKGIFSKKAMKKHLAACEKRISAKGKMGDKTNQGKIFHLLVEGRYAPEYWMHLEVPATATLDDLDGFLRETWLECCGHLSAFTIAGQIYNSSAPFAELDDEGMDVQLGEILRPKLKFLHEYDFGTTTRLVLKVLSEREDQINSKKVQLLARNEPPVYPCDSCGKPATQICAQCYEGGWLCDDCAKEHECGEEMMLPVVNSPRAGMCGYTGDRAAW